MCRRASGHSAVSWRINGTNREEKRRTLMEGEELVQRILQVDLNKSLTGAEFITINLSRQQRSRGVWHVAYVTERNRRYRRRRSSPGCPSDQFHAVIVLLVARKILSSGSNLQQCVFLPARVFVSFSSRSCALFF